MELKCDKCRTPVAKDNDAVAFDVFRSGIDRGDADREILAAVSLAILHFGARHLLPVNQDDRLICAGSPSRAQYVEGQPKDPRYPYDPEEEATAREAYWRLQHFDEIRSRVCAEIAAEPSPWDADNVKLDYDEGFEKDGYSLTEEMREKYARSALKILPAGTERNSREYLFQNASLIDVTGAKLTWADFTPQNLLQLEGVYYLLSEHRSFLTPDEEEVKGWHMREDVPDPKSPFSMYIPDFEPAVFTILHVKRNAIARVVDGEVHTSHKLISRNYD